MVVHIENSEVMTHGAKLTYKKVHNNIEDTSFFDIPLATTAYLCLSFSSVSPITP